MSQDDALDRHNDFIRSVIDGNYDNVVKHLQEGANPALSDENRIALHIAAWGGRDEIVKLLLEVYKNGIHAKNSWGATPLYDAVCNAHAECCRLLLEAGSIVDELIIGILDSVSYCSDGLECVKVFVDHGVSFYDIPHLVHMPRHMKIVKLRNDTRDAVLWLLTLLRHRSKWPPLFRVVGKDMLRLIALELWENRWR